MDRHDLTLLQGECRPLRTQYNTLTQCSYTSEGVTLRNIITNCSMASSPLESSICSTRQSRAACSHCNYCENTIFSHTFLPLSAAWYSFIQSSASGHEENCPRLKLHNRRKWDSNRASSGDSPTFYQYRHNYTFCAISRFTF